MTSVDRLVANSNSIITTLRQFSETAEQDVVFTWINDDDSIEEVSYANITKFQKILNDKFGELKDDLEGEWSDYKAELELNAQRADYCRRMEASATLSGSVTYSSDQFLRWENRIILMGVGSDASMYTTRGYLNLKVPATDTVIPAIGNAEDITVTDDGIQMKSKWGTLYYKLADNYDSADSADDAWVFVGYDSDTGVLPTNWISVAAFNLDRQVVAIAGHSVFKGRTIHPATVSDPLGAVDVQNVGGVLKDKNGDEVIGNVLMVSNDVNAIVSTDDDSAYNIVNVSFVATKDNPHIMVVANTGHAQENDTDQDSGDIDPSAGIGWRVGGSSDSVDDYNQFHGDKSTRENISSIGEFYVQDTILEYTANDGTFIYEIKPVGFSGVKQIVCSRGDTVNVALFVQSNYELYWGAGSNGNSSDTYRSNITVIQG